MEIRSGVDGLVCLGGLEVLGVLVLSQWWW